MSTTQNHSFFYSLVNIRSEFKTSIHLALPLIAAQLLYGISSFAATVMVSHLGKEQLAANALAWGIYLVAILFFIGVFSAVSILASQSFGAKDNAAVSICFKQGLILAVISAVPMMLLMWFSPIILQLTGQNPIVIEFAKPLFHTLALSMLPLNLAVVMQQILYGILKPRIVMYMNILVVPVEIFFYYALLFGKFSLPHLGLAGIGISLTISMSLESICFVCYLTFSDNSKSFHFFKKWWVINRKFFLELVRVGLPLGITFCMELALFALVAIMMGILGTTTLAAYQISYQFLMLAYFVIFGFTQCVLIRVGNEVGKNNRNLLRLAVLVNLGISGVITLVFSIFYFGFPHLIIGLDVDVADPKLQALISTTAKFLAIVSLFILTDGVRLIFNGALRGLKDTKFSMFASILGFWIVAFPCAYLLGFKLGFGGVGIWWGMVIGLLVSGILLCVRFWWLSSRADLRSLVTSA